MVGVVILCTKAVVLCWGDHLQLAHNTLNITRRIEVHQVVQVWYFGKLTNPNNQIRLKDN